MQNYTLFPNRPNAICAGRLVFSTTDPAHGWDGRRADGTPCPQGTYAYRYTYVSPLEPDRRQGGAGSVTLVR